MQLCRILLQRQRNRTLARAVKPKTSDGSFVKPLVWKTRRNTATDDQSANNKVEQELSKLLNQYAPGSPLTKHSKPKTPYAKVASALKEYVDSIGLWDKPAQVDATVWQLLAQLHRTPRKKGEKLALELLVDLFEVAKQQPQRFRRIKQVGDVIYSYGARLDPINESDYIDSLFTKGNKYDALKLWETRDDTGSWIFWMELGTSLYIRRYDSTNAERVANQMLHEFGHVPPKLMIEFIRMYSDKREVDMLQKWIRLFLDRCKRGFEDDEQFRTSLTMDDAVEMANKHHLPTRSQLHMVLEILLYRHYWDQASEVITEMHQMGIDVPVERTLQLVDQATRRIASPPHLQRKHKRNRIRASKIGTGDFVPLLSTLISVHPQVLNSEELYQSWLRGLTGMGLYSNALQVLDAMTNRGIQVDMDAFLRALLVKDQLELALDILEKMEKGTYRKPSANTYSIFIQYATRKGDDELLHKILTKHQWSDSSMISLLNYYATDKEMVDVLMAKVLEGTFGHSVYRTLWLILRKMHRSYEQSPQQLRPLVQSMVSNPNFRHSAHVYETAIHTLILTHDYVGAAGLLCYMSNSSITKPQGVLALGVLQVASKTKSGAKPLFPKSKDLETTEEGDPTVPWRNIVIPMCNILELDPTDTVKQAENLFQ